MQLCSGKWNQIYKNSRVLNMHKIYLYIDSCYDIYIRVRRMLWRVWLLNVLVLRCV